MGDTITVIETLTKTTCPHCAGVYAIVQSYIDEAYRQGGFKQCWACPYCKHERGYGVGEVDKLKKQLVFAESTANWHKYRAENAQRESEYFRKSRDAIKGVVTRIKKRVGNGICPCCQKSFQNLKEHMTSKHPHYHEPK